MDQVKDHNFRAETAPENQRRGLRRRVTFEISYLQYLDENAQPASDLPDFATNSEELVKLYRKIQFLRTLDARAIALQRTGKMGTYPGSLGQEAVGVGAGSCLTDKDVLVPYYRGTGTMIQHGVQPHEMLLYWGGDERGCDFKNPTARQDFPIAVPIATQCLHAVGVATSFKLRGQGGRAVLTEIGEGGTSQGEFYEALNVAGVWRLPVVFLINNNQWAISVPSESQTSCETYAQKALAAGIDCIQVDGNDIIAVKDAVGRALDKARAGDGATLVEAVTYRLCDHTTADDARRYRDDQKHEAALAREPLGRLRTYLLNLGVLNTRDFERIEAECRKEVELEVEIYLDMVENQPQPPQAMFDHLYQNLPEKTRRQRDEVMARGV